MKLLLKRSTEMVLVAFVLLSFVFQPLAQRRRNNASSLVRRNLVRA